MNENFCLREKGRLFDCIVLQSRGEKKYYIRKTLIDVFKNRIRKQHKSKA